MRKRIGTWFPKHTDARIERRVIEALSYLADLRSMPATRAVRVVIFGQGRTGSTLLESLLESTGHFVAYGELFNTDKGEILYPERFVRGLSKLRPQSNLVFHLKIYQLTKDRRRSVDPAAFLTTLGQQGWRVIHLRRRNALRQSLSNLLRRERGQSHKFDDAQERHRFRVDPGEVVRRVGRRLDNQAAERQVLQGIDYREVVYEDDLANADVHQRTVDGLMDFLSLERRPVTTHHRRINSSSLFDLIANYDEVAAAVRAHGFGAFLDDETLPPMRAPSK